MSQDRMVQKDKTWPSSPELVSFIVVTIATTAVATAPVIAAAVPDITNT